MAEPADMIGPMLREMQAESTVRHAEILARFDIVDRRLDALEKAQASFRQAALTADSLLSRLVTGEFEQRIELLERKVKELEALK